jgi:cytoskeleton protein RodZ
VTTYWQPHQVEQLRAIGLRLQQERERQNIILEDVSAKTRIRVALLQGIEAAEINRLPEPVYVRGFVRRFEETLGLPTGELSSQLVLEPTILGNVDPLMTYPPTPAPSTDSASTKSKKDLKKESPKEPQKLPEPTFRQAPTPLAEPALGTVEPAKADLPLPEVPAASLPLFQSAVDSAPIDVRPTAKPVELRPVAVTPVESKPAEIKPTEIKPAEIKPIALAPVVTPPVPPIDPWAEEPMIAKREPVAEGRSDIRIVPPPSREFEVATDRAVASDRPAPAALLPMPQAPKFDEPAPLPWRPIAIGVALLGMLGTLAWGAMQVTKSPTIATNPTSSAPSKPVAPIVAPVKPPAAKPLAPVSLVANFKDAAWIRVETDGKLAYEGEIPKGGQKIWTAQKGIFFRTGLASVVWLSVNGAPAKQFNSYSGPKDETFVPTSR